MRAVGDDAPVLACEGCGQPLTEDEAVYWCQEGPRCADCGTCTHLSCGPYFD